MEGPSFILVCAGGPIRFRYKTKLAEFARANHIEAQSSLQSKGWKCAEILYLTEGSGFFLSENTGSTAKVFYSHDGVRRQLHFKALNASAQEGAKK